MRGTRSREVAVLLLSSSPNPCLPIHYPQWHEPLRPARYAVKTQDHRATLPPHVTLAAAFCAGEGSALEARGQSADAEAGEARGLDQRELDVLVVGFARHRTPDLAVGVAEDLVYVFFLNDAPPPEISPLPPHNPLPI